MLQLTPIIAHETDGGFVWWDEALLFALPVIVAILAVLWIARRARSSESEDDQRV